MGNFRLRFYKRIRIAPGIRVNLSRGGVSTSLGGRGLWYTVSRGGRRRTTVGLPGTGVYFTRVSRVPTPTGAGAVATPHSLARRIVRWVLIAAAVCVLVALVVVIIGGALLSHH